MSAPAAVPRLMIEAKIHHRSLSSDPMYASVPSSAWLAKKVAMMEMMEVTMTKRVSGASSSNSFLPENDALDHASVM